MFGSSAAAAYASRAVAILHEAAPGSRSHCYALMYHAMLLGLIGRVEESLECAREVQVLAARCEDPELLAMTDLAVGRARLLIGEPDTGLALMHAALAATRELHAHTFVILIYILLVQDPYDLGRYAESQHCVDEGLVYVAERELDAPVPEPVHGSIQRQPILGGLINHYQALSIVAAVGDFTRFRTPEKRVAYLGLNPRVRQSGGQPASHGRITKAGPAHARGMLVEAAWSACKAAGPLRAFYQRVQARRGMQVAVVATARKLTVLCWHLIIKGEDYVYAQPSLVAHKRRKLELRAGAPAARGQKGKAAGYSLKAVRAAERDLVAQAERAYQVTIAAWQPTRPTATTTAGRAGARSPGVDVAATNGARLSRPSRGNAARQG